MSALPRPPARRRRVDQLPPSFPSALDSLNSTPPAKKPRGRPRGSKNSTSVLSTPSTLERPVVTSSVHWDGDGTDEVSSSLDLLIEWLGMNDNYECFKFGKGGKTQAQMSKVCEEWLQARGCRSFRSALSIQNKVRNIHSSLTFLLILQGKHALGSVEEGSRLEGRYWERYPRGG